MKTSLLHQSVFVASVVVVVALASGECPCASPLAKSVVDKYEQYVANLYPISVEFCEDYTYQKLTFQKKGIIRYDKNNYFVKSVSVDLNTGEESHHREFSFYDDVPLLLFKQHGGEIAVGSWFKPQDEHVNFKQYCLYPCLFGFFPLETVGDIAYIPDFMRKNIGGVIVTNETGDKITLTLTQGDSTIEMCFCNNTLLCYPLSFKRTRNMNDSQWEPDCLLSYHCVFENHESQSKFPGRCTYSGTFTNIDLIEGKKKRVRENYAGVVSFSNIMTSTLLSASDFKIQEQIPDYTEVAVYDVPQIQYIWLDGEVQPLTDALAEERVRGHKFIPGTAESRFWFIAFGIALIIMAVIGAIHKYFRNKKDNNKEEEDNNEK